MTNSLDGVAPPPDITETLADAHRLLRELFVSLNSAPPELVAAEFSNLQAELAQHLSAEELEVYPQLAGMTNGAEVVRARRDEHSDIEGCLARVGKLEPGSDDFRQELSALQSEFTKHAAEEDLYLQPLLAGLPSEQRVALAERYRAVKITAPTRPHPSPDAPPANRILDSIEAVVDRVRDVGRGRT